jgi:ABC-type transport system substrate-binding protein
MAFAGYHGGAPRNTGITFKVAVSEDERRRLYGEAQRLVAEDAPYVSLWSKTNYAVSQPDLTGIALSPIADFGFLKDVARTR